MKGKNTGQVIGIILAVLLGIVVIGSLIMRGMMAYRFMMAAPIRSGMFTGHMPTMMGRGFGGGGSLAGLLLAAGLIYLIVKLIDGPQHDGYRAAGHHGMHHPYYGAPFSHEPGLEEKLRFHEEQAKFHQQRVDELRSTPMKGSESGDSAGQ